MDSKKSSTEETLSSVKIHSCKRKKSSPSSLNYSHAWRVSSIKDLRMKRVFTPNVNSVPDEEEEEDEKEEKNEERKKLLKGSNASRILVSDVDELQKSGILRSEVDDKRNDLINGLNLKDQAVSANESLLSILLFYSDFMMFLALNRCCRRKVFKASSSFSYRRLLPYLMDIVNDASSVSKIEIVDAGIPCGLQKLDGVNSEVRSTAENSCAAKIEHVAPKCDDSKPSDNQDLEKVHIKDPFIRPNLSGAENELGQTAEIIRPLEVEQKGHENDMNGVDASAEEERIQTTPPDPGIFTKTEVGHGGESVEANKVLAENQTFIGLLVGSEKSNGDALKQSPDSRCDSNSMNRPVLNPCSRLRLFKNPRSLSYKRLLPFLMDISKNNSSASRKTQQPMPEVVLEEDKLPASAAGAEHNSMNKTTTENSHDEQHTEDLSQNFCSSRDPLPPSDGSSPDTNDSLVSSMAESSSTDNSSNVEPNSVNSETLPDVGRLIVLQSEEIPQSQISATKLELGLEQKESSSASEPSSTVNSDILTQQCTTGEPGLVGKQKMCLDMGLELHTSNAESIEKVNLKQNSFQVEASEALVSRNNGPPKGILKRNRRGCRGLCNCLNCASFRLHADRAFEFSRNQMHDAEEVASDLMKELAYLRLLLDESVIKNNDSSGIPLDPVLVKQACNKAVEAENLAKERLSEMNYDLSVHCRTPALLPPKVTFADNTQERVMPVLDPSSTERKG